MRLILRILITAVALWLTAYLIDPIQFEGSLVNLLLVAILFGLVNSLIRPLVKLITLPINVVTLGLFSLVINALMFMLVAWLSGSMTIEGNIIQQFLWAFVGSILVSIVSTILSWFLPDSRK